MGAKSGEKKALKKSQIKSFIWDYLEMCYC